MLSRALLPLGLVAAVLSELSFGFVAPASASTLSQAVPEASPAPLAEANSAPAANTAVNATANPTEALIEAGAAAGRVAASTRLVLSLGARQVSLFQNNRLVNTYPVAVGSPETPTPQGEFAVANMVIEPIWRSPWTGEFHDPGADSALGLRWIGFATSDAGSFGFHGTPTVDSIGKAVSNGCVRMRNEDIVALFEQVAPGTPVSVVP
jgi:lipoprotein-anchoring transpeptidase ErfK/SrfK